jgi:hypothetical protein
MSSGEISLIVLACVSAGAALGIFLRVALPDPHVNSESKESVRVGMGLVVTVAALVLGLMVASARASYDVQSTEMTDLSSKVILLDRVLAHYGPEAKQARDLLRAATVLILNRTWRNPKDNASNAPLEPQIQPEEIYDSILALSPQDDTQRAIKAQAMNLVVALGQTRWSMYEQGTTSVSTPMLVVLTFWLTVIFISFGVFAPPNATVILCLFASALSVSGAVFLILEMYSPYSGLIQISSVPLRAALAHLGQ